MTSYLCIGVWRESSGCNSPGLFLFLHILLVCLLLRLTYLTPVIVRLVLVKHDIAHPVIYINVLVCGQSDIVGRPLVDMLIKRHCNVISVNSSGNALRYYALHDGLVDVVISAVGERDFISPLDLFNVDVCIDVGINYDENGKQHGDCADAVYNMKDIKVTPRIGGVGLMTRAMLLYNVCVAKYGEHKMEEVIG